MRNSYGKNVSGRIKDFQNIKKEIQKMWSKLNNRHKKKLNSVSGNKKAENSDQQLKARNEESESIKTVYIKQTTN